MGGHASHGPTTGRASTKRGNCRRDAATPYFWKHRFSMSYKIQRGNADFFCRVSTLLRKWYLIINKLRNQAWPHPARTGRIVIRKLSRKRADIVREHVIAVIGTDGGEGDIVQDDLANIAKICAVRREIRPLVERH